jgi:FkbM family methyltransferase
MPGDPGAAHRRLIAAATQEFATHGIGGARLSRIAAEANVSKAQIYQRLTSWILDFRRQRRALTRRYLFTALSWVTPSVAVDTDGLRIYVSTADRHVSRAIFAEGFHERQLFDRVVDELRRIGRHGGGLQGRGFLDIGANLGTATCLALKHCGASRAWSFEPEPRNLTLLSQNIIANGLEDRVSIHAYALSDQEDSLALELSETNWGDHRVRVLQGSDIRPLMGESRRGTVQVPARRLDTFIEGGALDLGSIGLAWIDVQGHEAHVLDGAGELLRSDVPIVCEYWPYALNRAGGVERFHELVATGRSAFIDLNKPGGLVRKAAEVRTLSTAYPGTAFTDLLLLP